MPNKSNNVRPPRVSKEDTSAALGAAWARVAAKLGRGAFADEMGVDVKTLARGISGPGLPELHTAFASVMVDPTALQEVTELYGFEIRPLRAQATDDFGTIAELSRLVGQWVEVMADGVRDHRETLDLADKIREIMPHLAGVIASADRIRGIPV